MRTPTKRPTVEGCQSRIRISDIHPAGEPSPRDSGTIKGPGFAAEFVVRGQLVEIQFQQAGFPPATEQIRLSDSHPYLGGRRWWLVCPCGRRARRLFVRAGRLACRKCHGLAYTSAQKAHAVERAERMLAKLTTDEGFLANGITGTTDDWLLKFFTLMVRQDKLKTIIDPEHMPMFPCNARNPR